MPLFISLPSPHMAINVPAMSGGTTTIVAGQAYYWGFELYGTTTFTKMRTVVGATPSGNIDMGIYDATGTNRAPGNQLAHTGAIAAVAGEFTQNLTSNITLGPGVYWLAILSTVANTFPVASPGFGLGLGMGPAWASTSTALTVLPASAGSLTQVANTFGVEALVLNGFS